MNLVKKLILIFVLLTLLSCSDYIDKPKHLVDKNLMAKIIAELAINEQVIDIYPDKNIEEGTRSVLKLYNVNPSDFVESFKYYVIKEEMDRIANDAQKILLKKDPNVDKYIKEKQNQNGTVLPLVR